MEQAPDVFGTETEPALGGGEQAQHIAVRQQGAFRFAGGAGGVDHVGQVVRAGGDLRIGQRLGQLVVQ
ncbi:hypothetical protein D3C77_642760 [compost metagenome]